ncbi:transcriptional regulator, GntR family [Ruminiclostridium papyrosolvens DSM 2782]|uniref:Transcriptional regulator, GntR family n=1 Tax=Ruminiclostridium papyrosolvens DSM 2782 TaxID=588581 RepID=F1TAL7_9FIRM|nr:GntR family transcriptional regulator [Ruminiclostridium papyrosolvens]EGD48560.1 transcriptional regulator, GntR family [Ruminiclostridium papyrosolvens DSM 2782]WES32684.1 GntR family transcriptional regulator [Ruminiclostridium papyrosolvens DSM 2782]
MANDFSANVPIYIQIMNNVKLKIVSGIWEAGQRLQSVRELAVEFSVNPNTMQKALSELEREGLLYAERTSGRYVSQDQDKIKKARDEMAEEYTGNYYNLMKKLGYTKEEIIYVVSNRLVEFEKGGLKNE